MVVSCVPDFDAVIGAERDFLWQQSFVQIIMSLAIDVRYDMLQSLHGVIDEHGDIDATQSPYHLYPFLLRDDWPAIPLVDVMIHRHADDQDAHARRLFQMPDMSNVQKIEHSATQNGFHPVRNFLNS